jgi:hypothetical protein
VSYRTERKEDMRERERERERESASRSRVQERQQPQAPQSNDDLQTETQTRRQSSVPLSEFPQTIFMIPANYIRKHGRWWERYSSKHKCMKCIETGKYIW